MSLTEIVAKSKKPVTTTDLADGFRKLGLRSGQVVMCHSSLSAFGWICGGAQAFIEALENVLATGTRSGGSLVMPAQTGDLSAPMLWSNPPVPEAWWQTIVDTMPAFDPDWTPSYGVGTIPEVFRTQPGTLRSTHPQVSFSARGKLARHILKDHSLDYPLGDLSPLGKLYDLDAVILMAGSSWENCTALHLAEHRCVWSWKIQQIERAPVYVPAPGFRSFLRRAGARLGLVPRHSGMERQWISMSGWNLSSDDFEACGKAFEAAHAKSVYRAIVGNASCIAVPLREVVDFAVNWLPGHRNKGTLAE